MDTETLVQLIKDGRSEYTEELWLQVVDLVKWYATRFYYLLSANGSVHGLEISDLIQEAYFGFISATESFDPGRGVKFTYYLLWHIRAAFQATVGRTDHKRRDPLNYCISLNYPVNEEDDDPLIEHIADTVSDGRDNYTAIEEKIFIEQLHQALENTLNRLPDREGKALRDYYFGDMTQAQIAAELGCNPQRVAQLQQAGLHRIRTGSAARRLEKYLDDSTNFYIGNRQPHATENKVLHREAVRDHYDPDAIPEPEHGHFMPLNNED